MFQFLSPYHVKWWLSAFQICCTCMVNRTCWYRKVHLPCGDGCKCCCKQLVHTTLLFFHSWKITAYWLMWSGMKHLLTHKWIHEKAKLGSERKPKKCLISFQLFESILILARYIFFFFYEENRVEEKKKEARYNYSHITS